MNKLNENGWQWKGATLEDIDRVADLIQAVALADTGAPGTTREDKLIEWGLPQFNLQTDTRLVLAPDGQAVGYVELWDEQPHVRHYQSGCVHPDHRGQGLGSRLMDWAEARARQSLDQAPPEARVSLHTSAVHENRAAQALFRQRGFVPSRHFYRMMVEMAPDAPPPAPAWPEGIGVRPYRLGQEDRAVHQVLDAAMQDHWGYVEGESFEEWFHWIEEDEAFDPSLCFLAVTDGPAGELITGVIMARPVWEQDPSFAWIDELGVLRPWRQRGIGLALLRQCLGEFHRRGRYKAGLNVDGDSLTGAPRLYERAGMRVFQQRDAYEKELRPGLDLSTHALEA